MSDTLPPGWSFYDPAEEKMREYCQKDAEFTFRLHEETELPEPIEGEFTVVRVEREFA